MKKYKTGPSPVSYKPEHIKSRRKIYHSKLDRSGFIEDARARANDSPPPYNAKYELIKPRIKGRGFYPTKKDNMEPIKKKNEPSPGSYTIDKGYEKTIKKIRAASISKYNLPQLQDLTVKRKKIIPGVGTYKWENSFDKITRPPLFKKGKY